MVNMVNALGGGLFMRNGSYLATPTLSQARVSERSLRAMETIVSPGLNGMGLTLDNHTSGRKTYAVV